MGWRGQFGTQYVGFGVGVGTGNEPEREGSYGVNEVVVVGVGFMGWEVRNGDGSRFLVVNVVPRTCPMFVGQPTLGHCCIVPWGWGRHGNMVEISGVSEIPSM